MSSVPPRGGSTYIRLGVVEKWVCGVVATVAIGSQVIAYSDGAEQREQMKNLVTQQAVTNVKIETLTLMLANVPHLTSKSAELETRVTRTEADVRELSKYHATGAVQ
jgi:hypothetical protein